MKKIVLLIIFFSLNSFGAEVTLYAINSPKRLDWTTPRSLLISTVKNYARLGNGRKSIHKIGHAYLGFKCDGKEEIISGMTSGPGFDAKNDLFREKVGMSVLLMDNPGHFQDHDESYNDIMYLTGAYRVNALKIEISNEKCLKMQEWYDRYSSSSHFIYGGVDKRPLKGEGSGCTAYAMSYFEYADIDFSFFNKAFGRTIFIPQELMGGELGQDRDVRVKTLYKSRIPLDQKDEGDLQVDLYDPNDMYYWIDEKWLEYQRSNKASSLEKYDIEIELFNKMKILKLSERGL